MATLQQTLYQKIFNVTEYAHDIMYKGDNDRNRYQISDNLYVRYSAGLVTHIFDTDKDIGVKLQIDNFLADAHLVRISIKEMGPKGFYADVQPLMDKALKIFTPNSIIESYARTQTPLVSQLKITFDQLLTTIK